jgi:hypothetical protein
MNNGRTLFAQLMNFLPLHEFQKCVQRYRGEFKMKTFSCFDQFLSLSFAQLTGCGSLRDIEICLHTFRPKLYHAGFRGRVSRNTLAHANQTRDWKIFADFAQVLIQRANRLYQGDSFGADLNQTTYAFDSTTIDLCLTLFPWARFRKHKAAVKLHTLINLRGNIPCFVYITDGKVHDVNALDSLTLEPGAIYIMDRGYIDFARLHVFVQNGAFFVTRAKHNMNFIRLEQRPIDKSTGLRSDQTVRLRGFYAAKKYPDTLRLIRFTDPTTHKSLVFITNNFFLPALTVAHIYKCRWQVELFFKWIKQNLRIKSFYGTSENAVKTQIWIAISVYVLLAIVKKELNISRSLREIQQILSVSIFEKTDMVQSLLENPDQTLIPEDAIQLLFIN